MVGGRSGAFAVKGDLALQKIDNESPGFNWCMLGSSSARRKFKTTNTVQPRLLCRNFKSCASIRLNQMEFRSHVFNRRESKGQALVAPAE